MRTYAERWLATRKKQGHLLIPGTPMCDQVHSLLGLPPPPPSVDASGEHIIYWNWQLQMNSIFYDLRKVLNNIVEVKVSETYISINETVDDT